MPFAKILAGAVTALALAPAASFAATIAYSGDTLVLTAAAGEENSVTLGGEQQGLLSISDAQAYSFPGDKCVQEDPQYAIQCVLPARIVLHLGDGNDRAVIDHMVQGNPVVEVHGDAGKDELKAIDGNTRLTLVGGAGNDILRSEGGSDVLRGGADDDELVGGAGSDILEGGDGNDKLTGDVCETPGADVLDGGPGYDTLTDWGDCGPGSDRRPVHVTVNGVADDGRPGEGDDVRDLDVLRLYVPATVIGTDGPQSVEIYAADDQAPSTIDGRGGADDLRAGSGRETIDGGSGDDRIEGGFNHDTLTGGPGKDTIYGDSTSGNCGGYGQSCTIPFGNDVIHARDGEADTIDCGPGEDRAVVDAIDTVAANCETVEKSAGAGPGGGGTGPGSGPGGGGTGAGPAAPALRVTPGKLRVVLKRGLSVSLTGFKAGSTRVHVRAGRKLVASGSAKVGSDGRATVRARFTKAARRKLGRKRSVRLVVSAGGVSTTVTVKR